MATTWSGWTLSEIIDQLKGPYGTGWALDANILARVNRAVYSAWCAALDRYGEAATTTFDASDETSQPTGFNQYFGALAMYRAGMVIDPHNKATEMFLREAEMLVSRQGESDAAHEYSA